MTINLDSFKPILPPSEGPPIPELLDSVTPILPFKGYWPWYKVAITTGTTGILNVAYSPASAIVIVNGSAVSQGNNTYPVGTYAYSASASGYNSQSGMVTITAGQTTPLNINLTAISTGNNTGVISANFSPAIAVVTVGGNVVSQGQNTLNTGTYNWSASAAGYTSQSGTITVQPGVSVPLNITLVAVSGGGGGVGPFNFSILGINLPSQAAGWDCGFADASGNIYQRVGWSPIGGSLSQEGDSEGFETPVSSLIATIVVMAENPSTLGAGVSLNALDVYTINLSVQDGQTYTFDLTNGNFIGG